MHSPAVATALHHDEAARLAEAARSRAIIERADLAKASVDAELDALEAALRVRHERRQALMDEAAGIEGTLRGDVSTPGG